MSGTTSDTTEPAEGRQPFTWRRFLRRALPIAFYVVLVVFLVLYIRGVDWSQLDGIDIQWWAVVLATVISLGFRYWGIGIWFFILRRLGATGLEGSRTTLSYVYAKSWLGRYIPGAATWIVGKVYFASRHGVSKARLGLSGLLEGGLQIVATLALALVLLLVDPRTHALDPWLIVLMVAAFVVCCIVLVPRVFVFFINLALRLLRRPKLDADLHPSLKTVLGAAGLYVGGAILSGGAYYFIALAVHPSLSLADAPYVIGAASMASAISMLAVFAPGGLGVREGVQAVLLAVVMPPAVALIVVVVTRVWSVAVDGLFFLVAGIPVWFGKRRADDATVAERA